MPYGPYPAHLGTSGFWFLNTFQVSGCRQVQVRNKFTESRGTVARYALRSAAATLFKMPQLDC